MENVLSEAGTIGVFAIFATLLVKEVLLFVGKHPTQNGVERAIHTVPSQCPMVTELSAKVDAIHGLHMATDEDGVPVMPRLARQSRQQTKLLEEIRDGLINVRTCPLGVDPHAAPPRVP